MLLLRKKIDEIGKVLTNKQYDDYLLGSHSIIKPVYVSSNLERDKLCATIGNETGEEKYYVILTENMLPYYLVFLLNSLSCKTALFEGKINTSRQIKINKKKLKELDLIITEDKSQIYYEVAERLRQSVYTLLKDPNLDLDKVEVMISMFDNLCNALAFELYLHPILEELDIHIFQYWKEVIDTIKDQNNADLLIKELTRQDSPLRNQMMKLYMYATQISNKAK